jgi:hypothetical protein
MRLLLIVVGALAAILCIEKPAEARDYPWCAEGNYKDGATNCGFVTLQQCMDTVRGSGGGCKPNPMYQPSSEPQALPRHPRQQKLRLPQ